VKTIKIVDPVTRIEGHMKIEITVDTVIGQQQIVDARTSGTLFRGFEKILEGRDAQDATVITQRICGVCPISHGMASVMAVENAALYTPPPNARILRNLTLGTNFLQSHILHFYLLAALDFVPGPQTSPWLPVWDFDLKDHPDLAAVASHLPQAIEARRRAHEMGAVFGGRMPSSHTYIPGGFSATPTQERIDLFYSHLNWLIDFIRNIYLADVNTVAEIYPEYLSIGKGCENLLTYGVFDLDDTGATKLLKPGYVESQDGLIKESINDRDITESVTFSWYADSADNLTPAAGDIQPIFPKGDAYSWLKAPRYLDKPFEVGPLARMWVNGDYQRGVSVLDRHASRAQETLKIAKAMADWLGELIEGDPVYETLSGRAIGSGIGLTEAPRGALGHWVDIANGKIQHYQVLTPTCWNASPKDGNNVPGPIEQALIGTPVQDSDRPVEALRIIHSFDPCLSCAVHLLRLDRNPETSAKPVILR